jgi:hypothetical protein
MRIGSMTYSVIIYHFVVHRMIKSQAVTNKRNHHDIILIIWV